LRWQKSADGTVAKKKKFREGLNMDDEDMTDKYIGNAMKVENRKKKKPNHHWKAAVNPARV